MVSFGVKIMRTSARKNEEETVVDGRTGGLMGKPGRGLVTLVLYKI